jgi:hypothetical protein
LNSGGNQLNISTTIFSRGRLLQIVNERTEKDLAARKMCDTSGGGEGEGDKGTHPLLLEIQGCTYREKMLPRGGYIFSCHLSKKISNGEEKKGEGKAKKERTKKDN